MDSLILVIMVGLGLVLSLAQLVDRQADPGLKNVFLVVLGVVNLTVFLLGFVLSIPLMVQDLTRQVSERAGEMLGPLGSDEAALGVEPALESIDLAAFMNASGILGALIACLAIAALLLLVPHTRRLVARVTSIDPARVTHTVALHYVLLVLAVSGAIALMLQVMLADPEGLADLTELTEETGLGTIWLQNLGFVIVAALGVGCFVTRDVRETARRLGLTRQFSFRWWIGATIAALGSAWVTDLLWSMYAPESAEAVEQISEALFGPLLQYGLLAALTIGLAAGIGEETLFRGAAQPRFGLFLTAALFAAIHTQYTISPALIHIFLVGLLLGVVRQRVNTTTAIAVHATYNFILVMTAILEAEVPLLPPG